MTETRATDLMNRFIDTNAGCVGELLRKVGFTREGRIVQHPVTGVTVAANVHGYRITFYADYAPSCLGVIDLPADTMYGVVTDVASALSLSLDKIV